ncbi:MULTISPECIES: SIS domain-containing protein [Dysgonomonas]|uniref:SIS domain-containing protein n=1 Tax=Dysgonomonas TaxID=156973 RepID=UPI000928E577|nr:MULTISPECIES: SIS domain-containing protein [Dysgonomonas]MBN9302510.1 SIS domain-containing protein [Dysgonomonas mossii]OJX58880.1 MAG: phosphoheptose isomerase [Dysgonomonas sp. 37-18]
MKNLIRESSQAILKEVDSFWSNPETIEVIERAAILLSDSLKKGYKIISCGNGGSLCDATHFAEELTGRYRKNRTSLPAISINDPAYITCVGNDFSFDEIYSRYVEGVGCEGDVLLAISTSGNSSNIVKAVESAHLKKMKVLALTSTGDNRLSALSDIVIAAPKVDFSDRVQEIHIQVIHILIQAIEKQLGFE